MATILTLVWGCSFTYVPLGRVALMIVTKLPSSIRRFCIICMIYTNFSNDTNTDARTISWAISCIHSLRETRKVRTIKGRTTA